MGTILIKPILRDFCMIRQNALKIQVMLQKCLDRGIPVTAEEERDPSLLHAKLGAWMAENKYGVDDPEILSAITCHTTGKPGMSLLDKILYVADYIEPRRSKGGQIFLKCGSLPLLTWIRHALRSWRAFSSI